MIKNSKKVFFASGAEKASHNFCATREEAKAAALEKEEYIDTVTLEIDDEGGPVCATDWRDDAGNTFNDPESLDRIFAAIQKTSVI